MSKINILVSEKIKRVERLTPSLLAKAFRGKLVSRDPKGFFC